MRMRDSRAAPSRSKRSARGTELEESLERKRRKIALRISGKERHHPVDVADRHVRHDEAADESVDRRVTADAKSDGHDQREAQAPLPRQAPESMSNIIHRAQTITADDDLSSRVVECTGINSDPGLPSGRSSIPTTSKRTGQRS